MHYFDSQKMLPKWKTKNSKMANATTEVVSNQAPNASSIQTGCRSRSSTNMPHVLSDRVEITHKYDQVPPPPLSTTTQIHIQPSLWRRLLLMMTLGEPSSWLLKLCLLKLNNFMVDHF